MIAEILKERIENCLFRDEAIVICSQHQDLQYHEITEGENSYTSIFMFNDDSELRISTDNHIWAGNDESTFMANWMGNE